GLIAASATSTSNVWAVGIQYFTHSVPIGVHWDGVSWSVTPMPSSPRGRFPYLRGVVTTTPTDAFAVGEIDREAGPSHTLAERWDGSAWQLLKSPNPSNPHSTTFTAHNQFLAVSATSPTDVWAVGSTDIGNVLQPLMAHWNGTKWNGVFHPDLGTNDHE